MALIREDRFGPYIKSDGNIVRPGLTMDCYGLQVAYNIVEETKYNIGQKVKNKHYSGSTLHQVGDEVWCGHGCYYKHDGTQKDSDECWRPMI